MPEENQYRFIVGDEIRPDTVFLHMSPHRALRMAEHLLKLVDIKKDTVSIPVFGRLEAVEEDTL